MLNSFASHYEGYTKGSMDHIDRAIDRMMQEIQRERAEARGNELITRPAYYSPDTELLDNSSADVSTSNYRNSGAAGRDTEVEAGSRRGETRQVEAATGTLSKPTGNRPIDRIRGKVISPIDPTEIDAISSKYGKRTFFNRRIGREVTSFHQGIDLEAEKGVPVRAVADGFIVRSGDSNSAAGIRVEIIHPDLSITSRSLELSSVAQEVMLGQRVPVTRGEIIGYVGNSGAGTDNHLHIELRDGVGGHRDNTTPIPIDYSTFDKSYYWTKHFK